MEQGSLYFFDEIPETRLPFALRSGKGGERIGRALAARSRSAGSVVFGFDGASLLGSEAIEFPDTRLPLHPALRVRTGVATASLCLAAAIPLGSPGYSPGTA